MRTSIDSRHNTGMRLLRDLLDVPGLTAVEVLAGDPAAVRVRSVSLIERLADLRLVPTAGMAVLGAQATADARGYRLDVALREMAAAGVAGLVLTGDTAPERVPATVTGVATRADVAVLRAASEPLADLVVSFNAALAGGADEQVRVVEAARAALAGLADRDSDDPVPEARRIAADALGRPVEHSREYGSAPDLVQVRVLAANEPLGVFAVAVSSVADQVTARLVLTLAAATAGRLVAAHRQREDVPVRSRSAVLGELLVASGDRLSRLVSAARGVGVPIDGWHEVVRIELDGPGPGREFDELTRFATLESARRLGLQVARAHGRTWNVAQVDGALVLVGTSRYDPGTSGRQDTSAIAGRVLDRLAELVPPDVQWCGVGTAHEGSTGLLASAAEARTALAKGRVVGRCGAVTLYDVTGLGRMLVDWYASDSARDAVRALLRPLDELDRSRAEAAVETLHVYLDERGSTSRAGERLHLHRNAVSYRVRWITELLGVDLDDPDQRLALQLACRARLLR